ncbi:MAG: hypothetical protein JOZ36_02420 [Acidobacteria bacterium]|nr:hypothetical protein [Acidobacteriota bacterium]
MPLAEGRPFDHPEFLFELKYDGFRGLAVIEHGACTLYSRNGHPFASFAQLATQMGSALMPRSAVLDGEIVCLDEHGRCQFNNLLFRRGGSCFAAFDILYADGKDLRLEPLIDRKRELKRVLGSGPGAILYADHIDASGVALFEKACELDLEGVVAKHKYAPYDPEHPSWFKIRNRSYSQWIGREQLFDRDRHQEPVAGWHNCTLAAAVVEG